MIEVLNRYLILLYLKIADLFCAEVRLRFRRDVQKFITLDCLISSARGATESDCVQNKRRNRPVD